MEVGASLATGLGAVVGLNRRLGEVLIRSGVPMNRDALRRELERIADDEAPLASDDQLDAVIDGLVGMGPLEPLMADPSVSDILVNGPSEVWLERRGRLTRADVAFPDAEAIVAAVERMLTPLGLRIDRAAPIVDARLPDGSRLHAIIPPAAVPDPLVAIRRFTEAVSTWDELVASGTATKDQAAEMSGFVSDRANVVVSGGTGAGKTTLLNLLSQLIDPNERVVVIEDAAELRLAGHVVRLEARPPNAEGGGELTLTRLLRSALRLRPDRIVLGEVRGAEALDLVGAFNTGHAGSMSTVHANSPEQALWRLETLALSHPGAVSEKAVRRQLRAGVEVIVQIDRRAGGRRITSLWDRR